MITLLNRHIRLYTACSCILFKVTFFRLCENCLFLKALSSSYGDYVYSGCQLGIISRKETFGCITIIGCVLFCQQQDETVAHVLFSCSKVTQTMNSFSVLWRRRMYFVIVESIVEAYVFMQQKTCEGLVPLYPVSSSLII